MIVPSHNFWLHSPSEIFYFVLPILCGLYILCFQRRLTAHTAVKMALIRIITYFLVILFIHMYLSSIMSGKIIWREILIYLYFFGSVSIILNLMKTVFKMAADFLTRKIRKSRLKQTVHLLIIIVLWTFILFPYILATFTIHRPKIGDKYNPRSVFMLDYEDVALKTKDGLRLKGWYIPSENSKKAVVIGHGLGANKSNFLSLVGLWHSLDYNVLIFDFRGHGESEGHTISFGYKEKYDIEAGFDYLVYEKNFLPEDIVGYGVSFGGASLIHAVSDGTGFEKIITDSSFASIDTMADKVVERMQIVPAFLRKAIKNIGLAFVNLELGFDVTKSSPMNVITKINMPWLIIHGKKDVLIPIDEAIELFNATKTTAKKLYLVNSGQHYTTLDDPQYTEQIRNFLTNNPAEKGE